MLINLFVSSLTCRSKGAHRPIAVWKVWFLITFRWLRQPLRTRCVPHLNDMKFLSFDDLTKNGIVSTKMWFNSPKECFIWVKITPF